MCFFFVFTPVESGSGSSDIKWFQPLTIVEIFVYVKFIIMDLKCVKTATNYFYNRFFFSIFIFSKENDEFDLNNLI
jgi:hypothetical protein